MAEGVIANLHHGREGAAAEAGHGFDRELAIRIGIAALGNAELAPQRILDAFGAGHVTGGAATDTHNVPARGSCPEHVVERRHAAEGRGRDLRELADPAQSLLRKVAIVVLEGLQQRDGRIGRAPDAFDGLVHICQVQRHERESVFIRGYSCFAAVAVALPRHQTLRLPRR